MSYTVLALKWRPRRFGDLVGQQHVVQALVNSLAAGRLHHAYLFAGTRGVGKTTVARLLAKALNCEQGVATEPCGLCDACVSIDEGRFVDLLEVDAASRTRVDDTRELLDNVQYAPSRGRFKVYLIDEVHMLSTHSFNALLKTLEEPPPHVKFLLATTDPQKLPVTVLSRCLQFNLKKLTVAQIREQLEKICSSEQVAFESDALAALAEAAAGSMRDGQSLLDQAIAFGGGDVKTGLVNAMLGTIDRAHVLRILDALAQGDGAALVHESGALDEQAADFASVLEELMSALQRIAVIQLVRERDTEADPPELETLAAAISPEDVQLYYQIALQGRRDLAVCRDARMGFEMTLLRMLAFRPAGSDALPAEAPVRPGVSASGGQERPPATGRTGGASRPAPQQAVARERPGHRAQQAVARERPGQTAEQTDGAGNRGAAAEPGPPIDDPGAAAGSGAQLQPRATGVADGQEDDQDDAGNTPGRMAVMERADSDEAPIDDWPALLRAADVRGMARQLADHCEIRAASPGRLELVLKADKAHLHTQQITARLEAALSEHVGRDLRLKIRVGDPPRPTPSDVRLANESRRMREARETIEQDTNVRALTSVFDAVLEPDSIHPLGPGTER